MKKLIILAALVLFVACNEEKKSQPEKDFVVLSGKINNPIDSLQLVLYDFKNDKYITPKIDEKGNFRDTLKLEDPTFYNSYYGDNYLNLFLSNGMDLKINLNAEENGSVAFSGEGSLANNVLLKKGRFSKELYGENYKELLGLEKDAFNDKLDTYISSYSAVLEKNKQDLDSAFYATETKELAGFKEGIYPMYERQQKINKELAKGNPSPKFIDYTNYKGGTSSLSDFKGKYVYIDLWATWCVPCLVQMPYLEKIEEKYKDDNIYFVGISIDDPKNEDVWRKMIKEDEIGGIQLLADNAFQSQFIQDYYVQGIPRFILLDPEGNIVSHNAPRPSDPKLIELLDSLNI